MLALAARELDRSVLKTDPIDLLLLDSTGDLDLSDSKDLQLSAGGPGVVQALRIRIQLVVGEVFSNLEEGLDWYGKIWGQKFDQAVIVAEFRRVIIGSPGVERISSMKVSFEGISRTLTVVWEVQTTFGDTVSDSLSQTV